MPLKKGQVALECQSIRIIFIGAVKCRASSSLVICASHVTQRLLVMAQTQCKLDLHQAPQLAEITQQASVDVIKLFSTAFFPLGKPSFVKWKACFNAISFFHPFLPSPSYVVHFSLPFLVMST